MNSTDATFSAEASFGFIMADSDAFLGNAVPDPLGDIDAPWMHWDRRVLLPASDSGQHIHLDIRARRRFHGNDTALLLIVQNDDAVQSFEFALGIRVLVALP